MSVVTQVLEPPVVNIKRKDVNEFAGLAVPASPEIKEERIKISQIPTHKTSRINILFRKRKIA